MSAGGNGTTGFERWGWKAQSGRGSIIDCSSEVGRMTRTLRALVVLGAGFIVSGAALRASGEISARCLGGKRAALIQGHFTGPLVCSRKDATFVLVGQTAGNRFAIYDYRYRYFPEQGRVMHGGQKVVVFRDNIYSGQYALSPPPYTAITVNGSHVSLKLVGEPSETILDFSRNPPRQVLFGGEVLNFDR
jgi:hypothetical protein